LLTALWTGEQVHHHGRYYRLDGLHLPAVPVQRPRIPVWIGGDLRRPGTRRRLTRWIPPGHPDDTRKSIATGPPSLR
jgi:alkanesulfonate monooxygenase SsuD/methylene tetrahydromethanopterin reductase-like flavin-dependent oxidoreductase (luciferase family)